MSDGELLVHEFGHVAGAFLVGIPGVTISWEHGGMITKWNLTDGTRVTPSQLVMGLYGGIVMDRVRWGYLKFAMDDVAGVETLRAAHPALPSEEFYENKLRPHLERMNDTVDMEQMVVLESRIRRGKELTIEWRFENAKPFDFIEQFPWTSQWPVSVQDRAEQEG